uniref:Uncharacterized protein n=1 Tax=Siphoviridae sp. ctRRO23 TaxID=2826334 RepID=A0A8S5LSV8_9CAUD|nr:MAG TPA: hypothetical protein [Siphoviridae sp. ctRRO23]
MKLCDNITILSNDFYSCQYSYVMLLNEELVKEQKFLL